MSPRRVTESVMSAATEQGHAAGCAHRSRTQAGRIESADTTPNRLELRRGRRLAACRLAVGPLLRPTESTSEPPPSVTVAPRPREQRALSKDAQLAQSSKSAIHEAV